MRKFLLNLFWTAFLPILCASSQAIAFSYEYVTDGCYTSIHILIVDPKTERIQPVKAVGRETVLALALRYGASAAINGGFWKLDGTPAGILKIDNHWHGTPTKPRGAIGWSNSSGEVLFDRVLTSCDLTVCPDEAEIEVVPISDLSYAVSEGWNCVEHIVGGAPLLIRAGNLVEDYSSEQILESFYLKRHPRTAVGVREDGNWVIVVVDGRMEGCFGGATMKELTELMLKLKCVAALNLDGGGSSTLVVEGSVINMSCGTFLENGGQVEAVSDALLIYTTLKI
jgi:exopolysaccharide biosynthesis protein